MIESLGQFNRSVMEQQGVESATKDVSKILDGFLKRGTPRPFKGRLRISEMSDPCLRKMVLHYLYPEVCDPSPPTALQRQFDQGNVTHDWWQNGYYGRFGMLKGTWKCSICGREVSGLRPTKWCETPIVIKDLGDKAETTCAALGAKWRYKELWVEFSEHGLLLVGKCDGILYLGPPEPEAVLEMKSEDPDLWKSRTKPEPKDVLQASAYADLLGIKKVFMSYIEKSKWRTKDFLMDAVDGARDWLSREMKIIAELINEGKPDRAPCKCSSKDASRARRCGFRNHCF